MKRAVSVLIIFLLGAMLGSFATAVACGTAGQCIFIPVVSNAPTAAPNPTVTPQPKVITGLAIIGDSTQDEYRADDHRGGDYADVTFSWVELLAKERQFNLGAWGTRAEPRRSGYEFNWARSGATSQQMISTGQHTGAAAQASNGQISHAVIQIGINDLYFSGLGKQIYDGTINDNDLHARLNFIADNIATAAHTLKATNHCEVLVAATQDYMTLGVVPELFTTFQDTESRQRVIDAITYLNQQIEQRSAREGVSFFDFNAAYLAEINPRIDSDGFLKIGTQRVNLHKRGNEPHFGLLDDEYVHPGTILAGLYAKVYIEAFNRYFHTAIEPLSDDEILRAAGITP